MRSRPTRTVSISTTPTNIRKAPAFKNDPDSYPVTYATLRYASGGGLVNVIGGNPFARGVLTFNALPVATETLAVNGVTFTFIAGSSTSTDVQIGPTITATAIELANVLNASASGSITVATYTADGSTVVVTYDTAGTGGNSFTLANSSGTVAVTRSASTLLGGQAYASGTPVDADADYNDVDQSLLRYAASSTGSVDLFVTDWEA